MITVENDKIMSLAILGLVIVAVFLLFTPLKTGLELLIAGLSAAICSYLVMKARFKIQSSAGKQYDKVNTIAFVVMFPLFILIASVVAPYFLSL